MKNRFGNREVLCDGISFNPSVGGTGGIKPSANVGSAGPTGAEAASNISAIMEGLLGGEISKSGNVLGTFRSLGIVQS
jgi:hypothetical protein